VLPSPLSHAVETWSPPSKVFLISSLLVVINPLSPFADPASSLEYFWWRRRESNPRPTCLRFEGITTILSYVIASNNHINEQTPPKS